MPADDRLRRRLAMLAGDIGDRLVFEDRACTERRIGFLLDAVAAVEIPHVALLVEGVGFDLVDHRRDAGFPDDALEMWHEEIGDADRADETIPASLNEGFPGIDIVVPRRHGPMNEEHVE